MRPGTQLMRALASTQNSEPVRRLVDGEDDRGTAVSTPGFPSPALRILSTLVAENTTGCRSPCCAVFVAFVSVSRAEAARDPNRAFPMQNCGWRSCDGKRSS